MSRQKAAKMSRKKQDSAPVEAEELDWQRVKTLAKQLRIDLGWSLRHVAKVAEVSYRTVRNLETEAKPVRPDTLSKISRALTRDPAYLRERTAAAPSGAESPSGPERLGAIVARAVPALQKGAPAHQARGADGASDNRFRRGAAPPTPGTPDALPSVGETQTVAFAGGAMMPWYCPECGRQQDAGRKFCPWDGTARPIEMGGPPLPLDPARPAAATGRQRAEPPTDEEIARHVADLDDADAAAARPDAASEDGG